MTELFKMRKISARIILILVILIASHLPLAAAFKNSGYGARPAGMGGAFCAVADDSNACFWNPAGLVQIECPETSFMYAKLFTGLDKVDMGLAYSSIVYPTERAGNFGVSWANFNSKNLYHEDTVVFSYARAVNEFASGLKPEIYIGANIKYLLHGFVLDKYTSDGRDSVFANGSSKWNVTGDVGILVKPNLRSIPGLGVGLVVKSFTQPDVGLKTKDAIPSDMHLGFSYSIPGFAIMNIAKVENVVSTIEIGYRMQEWGDTLNKMNCSAGCECWFLNKILGIRAGANIREATAGFSLNKGLTRHFGIRIDYAFIWPFYIQETCGSHRVSLVTKF